MNVGFIVGIEIGLGNANRASIMFALLERRRQAS